MLGGAVGYLVGVVRCLVGSLDACRVSWDVLGCSVEAGGGF